MSWQPDRESLMLMFRVLFMPSVNQEPGMIGMEDTFERMILTMEEKE